MARSHREASMGFEEGSDGHQEEEGNTGDSEVERLDREKDASVVAEDEAQARLMTEKLRRQVELAQRLFDDRTLVPVVRPKSPEQLHSSLHILWGIVLLLVVVFVQRLPRYPGGHAADRVFEGDGLKFWEAKQLLGSNLNVGLLKRLGDDPESSRRFQEFSQLSEDSLERRDKFEQCMHTFQKQMIQALNPVLVLRDHITNALDQLPPRSSQAPLNAEELCNRLTELNKAAEQAYEAKAAFLRKETAGKAGEELHPDPAVSKALRHVMTLEAASMHSRAALLDFQVSQAIRMRGQEAKSPQPARKEMLALENKVQLAKDELNQAVAACLEVLPEAHHWMLLLFVRHLPAKVSEADASLERLHL
ncbi:hypothetical protein ACSSS7_006542 [Eimeria intestinalis]